MLFNVNCNVSQLNFFLNFMERDSNDDFFVIYLGAIF